MTTEKINYLEILKGSWEIVWKNKFLWWFGLFLALGTGGGINFSSSSPEKIPTEKFFNLVSAHLFVFISGLVLLIILSLALWFLKTLSLGGIIQTLSEINNPLRPKPKFSLRKGLPYWKKIIFLEFSVIILALIFTFILSLPVIFLLANHSLALGIMLGIVAVLILVVLLTILIYTQRYAYFYLVLSGLSLRESLESAYQLFRKNIGHSLVFSLIFIPLEMLISLVFLLLLILLAVPGIPGGILLYSLAGWWGAGSIITLGLIIFFVVSLFVNSIYQSFRWTSWFLFFNTIAKEKVEEKLKEAEKIKETPVSESEEIVPVNSIN